MTKIKMLSDELCEELEDAKKYAERYVEYKVRGQSDVASMYKKMANDELAHGTNLHGIIVNEIKAIEGTTTPPQWMLDKWSETHKWYVEKEAFVKQILNM